LQGELDVARRDGLAPHLVRGRQHLLHAGDAFAHRLRGAAGLLDRHGVKELARLQPLGAHEAADLVRLAAEAEDEDAGEVRVPRVTGDGAAEHVHPVALARHAAAGSVHQCDDAVDIGILGERGAAELLGDVFGGRRRAIDRADDAEIVARRNASVGPDDASNVAR